MRFFFFPSDNSSCSGRTDTTNILYSVYGFNLVMMAVRAVLNSTGPRVNTNRKSDFNLYITSYRNIGTSPPATCVQKTFPDVESVVIFEIMALGGKPVENVSDASDV